MVHTTVSNHWVYPLRVSGQLWNLVWKTLVQHCGSSNFLLRSQRNNRPSIWWRPGMNCGLSIWTRNITLFETWRLVSYWGPVFSPKYRDWLLVSLSWGLANHCFVLLLLISTQWPLSCSRHSGIDSLLRLGHNAAHVPLLENGEFPVVGILVSIKILLDGSHVLSLFGLDQF